MSTNTRIGNANDFRETSVLDRRIPLGLPHATRPEFGLAVAAYFREKHARKNFGRFWPLHMTAHSAEIKANHHGH